MGKINIWKPIFIFWFLTGLMACSTSKSSRDAASASKPQTVFALFKISKDVQTNKSKIQIKEKMKSDGALKEPYPVDWKGSKYLTFEIIQKGKVIHSFTIEHPLYKRVEHAEGNDLKSKQLDLNEEDFFVRFQIDNPDAFLKVYETLQGNDKTELLTIQL